MQIVLHLLNGNKNSIAMVLIDYPYYRFFMWERKRHESYKDSVCNASIFATALFLAITLGLWGNLLLLFFHHIKIFGIVLPPLFFYFLYKRYKKITVNLYHKYKNYKLNTIIPNGCIPLFLYLYFVIGVAIMIPIDIILDKYFERGELGDYILSLFS